MNKFLFIGLMINVLFVVTISGAQALQSCDSITIPIFSCPSDCYSDYGITDGGWWYDVMDSVAGDKITQGGCAVNNEGTTHIISTTIDCMKSNGVQKIRSESCHCWKCSQ